MKKRISCKPEKKLKKILTKKEYYFSKCIEGGSMKEKRSIILFLVTIVLIVVFSNYSGSQEAVKKGSNPYDIDYDNPDKYLQPGKKTNIKKEYIDAIHQEMSVTGKTIDDLRVIFLWKELKFRKVYTAGKYVGKSSVNFIFKNGVLTGHHDDGLLLVSVFREYGFPSILVESAGIQWAYDYEAGKTGDFVGYVFVEVFVEGKWILMDSTSGRYVDNYDPLNPVIPMLRKVEQKGYYVMFKGLDTADYGIKSYGSLKKKMKAFAKTINGLKLKPPKYTIKSL